MADRLATRTSEPKMKRRHALETLSDAVEWLRAAWIERDVPSRLHEHSFEGEGPFFAPAFARYLDAQPDDRLHDHGKRDENTADVCAYRYPMWRAMTQLRHDSLKNHDRVLTLVVNAFDIADACHVLRCREGHLLDAIRALHSRYTVAPEARRSWLDKSEAQRNAETLSLVVTPALS